VSKSENGAAAIVITIILVLALAIQVAKMLLPWFIVGVGLSLILLAASAYFESEDLGTIGLIGLIVCFVGALICFGIGYGFGESNLGKATTDIARAFGVIQETQDKTKDALIDVTKETVSQTLHASNASNPNLEQAINSSLDIAKIIEKTK